MLEHKARQWSGMVSSWFRGEVPGGARRWWCSETGIADYVSLVEAVPNECEHKYMNFIASNTYDCHQASGVLTGDECAVLRRQ